MAESLLTSGPFMKLIVMTTLLLSDADVFFTYASFLPYLENDFVFGPIAVSIFTLVYLLGTHFGNLQARKFCKKLRANVELGSYKKRDGSFITIEEVSGSSEAAFRNIMISHGLGEKFFQERSCFIRNVVKWKHSVPFVRLARFGWQADIPAGDFAGILNANALYSFTIGAVQLGCSVFFLCDSGSEPLLLFSIGISTCSLLLSFVNIVCSFPQKLNDIEKERMYTEGRQKDFENKVHPHVMGMREECNTKLKALTGKADASDQIVIIIKEYQDKEDRFLEAMKDAHERQEQQGMGHI